MYEGTWALNHGKYGEIRITPTPHPIEDMKPMSRFRFVNEVIEGMRGNDRVYDVQVGGQQVKPITYPSVGRKVFPLGFLTGETDEYDKYDRPAVVMEDMDYGIVPVLKGGLSYARFRPLGDADLATELHRVNLKLIGKQAATAAIVIVVFLALSPVIDGFIEVVKGRLLPGSEGSDSAGLMDNAKGKASEWFPRADPANNQVLQTMIDYKLVVVPVLVAVIVILSGALTPLRSRFWTWAVANTAWGKHL